MALTVGSLFSGIGGMDLGLERAGMKVVWQVEIDEWCRKVLAKHWPDVERHADVRDCGAHNLKPVDLVCGGFPCQEVSDAGTRAGLSGPNSGLYRELLRCIRVVRPKLTIVENVAALLHRGMGTFLGDLAEIGNDAEWDCIQAGAFGAHFRGDRVYIFAHDPAASSLRWQRGRPSTMGTDYWGQHEFERLVRLEIQHAVPAGKHGRVSDGIPNRIHRLRGLGNAVVPQVAEWIGRRIVACGL